MEQTWCVHGERRPRNGTCILSSPAGQSHRSDPGQVTRYLSSDKWQVKPGGAHRHIPQRRVTRTPDCSSKPPRSLFLKPPIGSSPPFKPPSAITARPVTASTPLPPLPAFAPTCIHYSPCSLHRQHSHDCWLLLPLPSSPLNTINLVIAFVLGVWEWLSKPPMILQAYTLAALPCLLMGACAYKTTSGVHR